MKKSLRYQSVEVQFLYPFEISEWRKYKLQVLETLDNLTFSKNPGRSKELINLEREIPANSIELDELQTLNKQIKSKNISTNNELFAHIEDILHEDNGDAHELFKLRLKKLKEKYENSSDERFFKFLGSLIENDSTKVFFDDSEKKGTRPYLQKSVPHILISLPGANLGVCNANAFPNINTKLNKDEDSVPYIRMQTNIRLLASGFGLVKMRCCLSTKEGLEKTVNEIVFSSETESCVGNVDHDKELLISQINREIYKAIKNRDNKVNPFLDKIDKSIGQFCNKHCHTSYSVKQNIHNLIDRINIIKTNLSTSEIVDIQNLDRGTGWGKEPMFEWACNDEKYGPNKLYKYFDNTVNKIIIDPIKNRTKENLLLLFPDNKISEKLNNNIDSTLSHVERNSDWYAEEGIYPYVLTFVAAPSEFSKPNAKHLSEIEEYFSNQIDKTENKVKLARLLMKSSWKKISIDVDPMKSALQNVFYSDLLFMAVHIRSTLCFYYLPSNPVHEYEKYPELYNSVKYKRELEDTLVSQRILWYMYTTFNHKVNQEIKSISKTFESLTAHIKKEEFNQILDELTEIIMGIDNRKIAITEVMEDPLNRKGSTLFTDMLNKSSDAFRLKQLYQTLNDQLDRLDMLGLHVNQTTNELSSLVIQETTRSTQFTLEILESFFIGVYFAEIVELAAATWLEEHEIKTIVFFTLAIAMPLVALPLISLIRKSISRFRGSEPKWQEWLEKIGLGVGLAMLSGLVFLILVKAHIVSHSFLLILLLITLPVFLYGIWYKLNSHFHHKHK